MNAKIKSEQYESIQQELLEVENQKLHVEQEMLEFVEQKKIIKSQNANLKQSLDYRTNKYNELMQKNNFLKEQLMGQENDNDIKQ